MESGALAGRYQIQELVGEGGMGRVFRAHDHKLRRAVAIKLLRADRYPAGSEPLARLLREARLAATLDHPGAVAIYDVGEDEGGPFIVMEFVVGRSLRELMNARTSALSERLRWLIDIAKILAAAHRQGLVHRDVKPENVLVRADGSVKLLDFGIALQMRDPDASEHESHSGAGTPRYMAPEQIQRRDVDARTDQFAWGVVAYELLGGELPWRSLDEGATTAIAVVTERQRSLSFVAPEVPERLAALVDRALEKSPTRRHASMDELVAALESVSLESTAPDLLGTLPDPSPSHVPGLDQTQPSDTRAQSRASTRASPSTRSRPILAVAVLGVLAGLPLVWRLVNDPEPVSEPEPSWHPSPEAQAAFNEGMRRFESAALHEAIRRFAMAVEYEPEFAAAHLRLAVVQMIDGPHPVGSEAYHTAVRLRGRLDSKDRGLLDVLAPVFEHNPPAIHESARRLELLASYYASDVELQLLLGMMWTIDGREADAEAVLRGLLEADSSVATAWLNLAYIHGLQLRLDDAADGVSRCLQVAPDAIDCLWYGIKLDAFAGRCGAMEIKARTWMQLGPDDHGAPLSLVHALVGQHADPAKIEAAEAEAQDRMTLDLQAIEMGFIRAGRSILEGQFEAADGLLAELPARAQLGPRELIRVGELRVALHEEMDDLRGAAAIAADYRKLERSLFGEGYDAEGDICSDPTPYFDAILLAAGDIDRIEFERRRAQWLTTWRERVGSDFDDLLWLRAHAQTTRSAADAHDALSQYAKLESQPSFVTDRLFVVDTAHVHLLAGQPEQAVPVLRAAVRSCLAVREPLRFVRAHELLGRALEAIGDREGACSAYAAVLGHWAITTSRTARAAAQRLTVLGCEAR